MQVILSVLIHGLSAVQDILSVLIQDFSAVQVFFISANRRFSIVQELSGFFSHQCYYEVSVVQGSVVQGPSVYDSKPGKGVFN